MALPPLRAQRCIAAAKALGVAVSRNPRAPHGSFERRGLPSVGESVALLGS